MKSVLPHEIEAEEQKFSESIYQNQHFGWLNLAQLHEAGGMVFSDENTLIGIQYAGAGIAWLHTFRSRKAPGKFGLTEELRKCLPKGLWSVYAISSHNWFTGLLQYNGFQKRDDIIQFQTSFIRFDRLNKTSGLKISEPGTKPDYTQFHACEAAFPQLWQLSEKEFGYACEMSSYRRVILENDTVIGYLLADLDEESCHIDRLAVAPAYMHRGAASALTASLAEDCARMGIRSFSVNTYKKNSAAVQFYTALNFHIENISYPIYNRIVRGIGGRQLR